MFNSLSITLTNPNAIERVQEPVTLGVPFARGDLFAPLDLQILDSQENNLPSHVSTLARWPDSSIKWALLDFQVDMFSNEHSRVYVTKTRDPVKNSTHFQGQSEITVDESEQQIAVNTGEAKFAIGKTKLGPIDRVFVKDRLVLDSNGCQIGMIDAQDNELEAVISSIETGDKDNSLRRSLILYGSFKDGQSAILAEFSMKLTFYAGKATVKLDFRLLNSKIAEHPDGLWDLGGKTSLFFKDLSVYVNLVESDDPVQVSVKNTLKADWNKVESGQYLLYQDSSGGKNWKSSNHVNRDGDIPIVFKGYKCFDRNIQIDSGNRATPFFNLGTTDIGVTAHICNFWQNFPKAIKADNSSLQLKIFPDQFSDVFELQGGEQKTHSLFLDFSNNLSSLDWCSEPLKARISLDHFAQSKVMPWLPSRYEETTLQKLIDRGVKGDRNFFDKRETIDEYGWRNFGDIFADHEGLEYKGSTPIISHYNNQYDALYGFIRQYVVTGDSKWHELLTDLAQHIVDIDIYNTTEDRDEYNGGLFWHTDHYVNAFTCTHRTFSIKNTDSLTGVKFGGGPGKEHCYTTGLAYYFFLTGEMVFKEAALKLVKWITVSSEGSGTIAERLVQFKSRDIPAMRKILAGHKVLKHRYPLTRATGNYITALVDAYNLTDDSDYIKKVENVIKQSIHPNEDISLRNLENIETGWSYLIFLQAICKYLDVKLLISEADESFFYARDSLIHYTDWMVSNECPFLEKSELLEFPNHTWTAQDLRKANILFSAACYDPANKDQYVNKARYFAKYVAEKLEYECSSYYSRILIILMQNYIHESCLEDEFNYRSNVPHASINNLSSPPPPLPSSIGGIFFDFTKDIGLGLLKFSLKNEIRWLRFRIKS